MSYRTHLRTTGLAALVAGASALPALADFVINDDLIVDGSACIGFDCVNGESFGFDTLRLKENNLRIKFDDTSVAANFPRNDWQLTANDSANGGASKFSIDDISGGRTPFTVEAGAPSHSLYVDDGGRIGNGTSTPSVEFHMVDGDTPTVRLQQDGSSGFAPQTWDVAGNETNFFIRDVTNGSLLPFRIRPEAPSNSIFVDTDGDVGMGTSSPGGALHINRESANVELRIEADGGSFITFADETNDDNWFITKQNTNNGRLEFGSQLDVGGANTFTLAAILEADGDMTIDGTLTQNSDKNAKMAIVPVDTGEILEKVAALPVSSWVYKDDTDAATHIGPMAQDFYALFGTGASETGISSIDTSGVALAAIQALVAQNAALTARLETLEAQLAD